MKRTAIKRFIFGNSSFDSMVLPTIDMAYDLWKELSSQSNSGHSVKLGTITPDYVESTFRRIIGVMAAVLKLREGFYSE